jgi:ATP-dependent RNA helicase SUPV3L1/SUV3
MSLDMEYRIRNVTAVLGPTNTGKTHLAIERMLGHETGMIGLPLRLLAREVYDKIVARVGADKVALITGEEKIKPEAARYWVCTVEAMPHDVQTDFLAIDEIQLAADPERGHVFTDRLLNARGKLETLMLGAGTMRDAIADLIPGANFISRPRLSKLTYAGEKKITRLPPRSAIVSFSASDVYAIAELVRRQRGGAAVVLGALSPRTRNAQVALFQSGDVDFLIATDAIGMGLNLDVEHVALAQTRKFDGQTHRELTASELGQIAGRAGRHLNDGTFGVTGGIESLSADMIERLENHTFDPLKVLQWRARDLDFASLDGLRESLRRLPREQRLQRARMADDVTALETIANDREIADLARGRQAVELIWDVCQVPDYRKISATNHAELVATLYKALMTGDRRIPEDWMANQVAISDRTDGDIDTLSTRLAHIRTWTFISNRAQWLKDPLHWQEKTRAVEDSLSDALHERLTQRFVDRRTSALMRGMRDKDELYAEIADDGAVHVEKHFIGRLKGFRFQPETQTEDVNGKAARAAAAHVLAKELGMRARRVASAKPEAFKLTRHGAVMWRDEQIAVLAKGDTPLKPAVSLLADEHLTGPDKEKVQDRLNTWITDLIGERLKPLVEIAAAEDVAGLARGIAFRMTETFGVLRREAVGEEVKTLDQTARAQLRKYGVRFGAFNIFFPILLKPAAAELALVLWTLQDAGKSGLTLETLPEPPRAGLTSVPVDPAIPEAFYRTLGFHVCGPRAVRIDMLERLADLIRPLLAWRPDPAKPSNPPIGSTGDGAFIATPNMMSILGCSSGELGAVLNVLGFRSEKRPKPVPVVIPPTPTPSPMPAETPVASEASESTTATTETQLESPAAEAAPERQADISAESTSAASEPAVESVAVVEPVETVASEATDVVAQAETTAPAEAAPADPTPTEAAPPAAEPVMIEVWRPRRRHQHQPQHNRHRPNRGNDRPGAGAAPTGDQAAMPTDGVAAAPGDRERKPWHRDRNRRRDGQKRGEQPATPAAAAVSGDSTATPVADAASAATPSHERPREDRPRHQDRDRRPDGGNRDGKPRNNFGDRRGGERGGKRFDGERRENGRPPQQFRAGPTNKSRGPDPDSPFAALSALKVALEKGNKD